MRVNDQVFPVVFRRLVVYVVVNILHIYFGTKHNWMNRIQDCEIKYHAIFKEEIIHIFFWIKWYIPNSNSQKPIEHKNWNSFDLGSVIFSVINPRGLGGPQWRVYLVKSVKKN